MGFDARDSAVKINGLGGRREDISEEKIADGALVNS